MQGDGAEGRAYAVREPPGNTSRDAMNALHEIMVAQASALSIDGACSKHGWYLICNQKPYQAQRTSSTDFRQPDDGSDSQILSVWSEKW